jgi:hypothetical protein
MTTHLRAKSVDPSGFIGFSSSFDRFLNLLQRTCFLTVLVSLIWLPGLFANPVLAAPIAAEMPKATTVQLADAAERDRMSAVIDCLPKQLSQPSLKRAMSEMGNDQIERAFNLKSNPKLSQAEVDLESCLSRQKM